MEVGLVEPAVVWISRPLLDPLVVVDVLADVEVHLPVIVVAVYDLSRNRPDDIVAGADAKVGAFFALLARLRRSEGDPDVKILVFTEFMPTQEMLLDLLEAAGGDAISINGSMSLSERALAQEAFRSRGTPHPRRCRST